MPNDLILLVDDEPSIIQLSQMYLEREGYRIDSVRDGESALGAVERLHPALVVLDVMLPKLDGFEVCRRLRASNADTAILMLTARDEDIDKILGLELGADDYLTKPFSHAVLVARLRALLRRGTAERPAILAAGDLSLDPAARRAWRGRTELDLTTRETALLEFLLRRRGEVLSKHEILTHVWDFDFDGDPNIVEVYIGHLRRKVDRPFGRTAIRTLRGAGYRLEADGG